MTVKKKIAVVEEVDPNLPGYQKAETVGDRIKLVREWRGVTQKVLSQQVAGRTENHRARSSVSQWERGQSITPLDKLVVVADFLRVRPEYLAFGVSRRPVETTPDPDRLGYAMVPEVIFETPATKTVGQYWGIPTGFLRNEISCATLDNLIVHKVESPSDAHEVGDRVIVDLNQHKPSPPGHFLYWDGLAANIARIGVSQATPKLMVRVTPGVGTSFEVPADKVTILGRVKGTWKKN